MLYLVRSIISVLVLVLAETVSAAENSTQNVTIFVADEVLEGLGSQIADSWTYLNENFGDGKNSTPENVKGIWKVILEEKLQPWHNKIREIDRIIEENRPSKTLNPKVKLDAMPDFENLAQSIEQKLSNLTWIDYVKDGWVKISSMMSQIHWKYDFYFDPVFNKSLPPRGEKFDVIYNDTLQIYFAWFRIQNQGTVDEQYCLNLKQLSNFSKIVADGTEGKDKNMFHGLKALLDLPSDKDASIKEDLLTNPCPPNAKFAGKGGDPNLYLPVYVLLHLLNAEFKYYIVSNIGSMYSCLQGNPCDYDKHNSTKNHLNLYLKYYINGILEAFEHQDLGLNSSQEIPAALWRWRCDPPLLEPKTPEEPKRRDHRENSTYTRMYDFETAFIEEERNVSLTQTCRETCVMFDGAYSSTPCPEDNWSCLDQEKHFDCYERRRMGYPCPSARTVCPMGISCQTAEAEDVDICRSKKPGRYIEWVKTDNGTEVLGKNSTCEDEDLKHIVTEQIMERSAILKREPQTCEICLCKCYEPLGNDSHRFLSLIPQEADISEGYAMIGAKFVKAEKIIHLVIAEGKLVNGDIDPSTIRWKEPKLGLDTANSSEVFRIGKDSRRILLDDFLAPPGHVISGVRLVTRLTQIPGDYQSETVLKAHVVYLMEVDDTQMWRYNLNESELAIEVQVTPLSKAGIFEDPSNVTWMRNANLSEARTEINLGDPDDSTLSEEASIPQSNTNEFVVLRSTSIPKDAGQTPVPFFDAQNLIEEDNDLSPLRAFGLFYKGQPGFGGFLTLRMLPTVNPSVPPPDPSYDLWKLAKKRSAV